MREPDPSRSIPTTAPTPFGRDVAASAEAVDAGTARRRRALLAFSMATVVCCLVLVGMVSFAFYRMILWQKALFFAAGILPLLLMLVFGRHDLLVRARASAMLVIVVILAGINLWYSYRRVALHDVVAEVVDARSERRVVVIAEIWQGKAWGNQLHVHDAASSRLLPTRHMKVSLPQETATDHVESLRFVDQDRAVEVVLGKSRIPRHTNLGPPPRGTTCLRIDLTQGGPPAPCVGARPL